MATDRQAESVKRKGAFSIPSVEEIREASKIGVGSKRSVFESRVPPPSSKTRAGTFQAAKDVVPVPHDTRDPPSDPTIPRATEQPSTSSRVPVSASTSGSDITAAGTTSASRPYAIIINPLQKKNPLMKYVRNVSWEVGDIVPDFELGKTTCALYLSIRYHSLHPEYIHDRLRALGKMYLLRILLVHVDTSENRKVLRELTKMALLADLTLMLAWSYEEAARYLETYKAYENKPPDLLKERVDSDFSSRVTECLTTVKKVNKTDAGTLINTFRTMEKLINASKEDLTLCPGLGPQKAQRLHSLFQEPFLRQDKTDKTSS